MRAALTAGAAYFAAVFAAGFVLGTIRTLLLAPRVGEIAAVLMETPVVLGISWLASRRITETLNVPTALPPRLVMGGVAFALLMLAEAALAVLLFGRTLDQHLAGYLAPAGAAGLLAQLLFAVLPALQRSRNQIRAAP